jgi:hypothetical protein
MARMDIVAELVAANTARQQMLDHLTRAYTSLDHAGSTGAVVEARRAVDAARKAAYVDGRGGPLPELIADAVRAATRLDGQPTTSLS